MYIEVEVQMTRQQKIDDNLLKMKRKLKRILKISYMLKKNQLLLLRLIKIH